MKKFAAAIGSLFLILPVAQAELVQQFKDPTFSGNGWTTQVLTIQQMEQSAKAQVDARAAAAASAKAAATANTPVAKFFSLFTNQVYSQLATQLSNNLFSSCKASDGSAIPGCNPATSGELKIDTTTTINWFKTPNDPAFNGQSSVTLRVTNTADSSQNTSLTVPIASFAF